jgi:hypothetical protein
VRLVDNANTILAGYPGYLAGAGILIPPPLKPFSAYSASVVWEGASAITATQTLSFRTGPAANRVRLTFSGDYAYGESDAPHGVLTASRPGRTLRIVLSTRTRTRPFRARLAIGRLSPGRWQVCVSSGGGTSGYLPQRRCAYLKVFAG